MHLAKNRGLQARSRLELFNGYPQRDPQRVGFHVAFLCVSRQFVMCLAPTLPCFDTHLLSLKPLAIGHQLLLRNSESLFQLSLGSSSLLSIALQSFQCRLRHLLFPLHFDLLVLYGLARFLLFSVFNVLLVYFSLTLC